MHSSIGVPNWRLAALVTGGLFVGSAAWADEPNLARLLPALQSTAPTDRLAAIHEIGDLTRGNLSWRSRRNLAAQVGPQLVRLAGDADVTTRHAALDAIARLGISSDLAAPVYANRALAPEASARQIVAQAVAVHLRTALNPVTEKPADTATALAAGLADARGLTPVCIQLLGDGDAKVRRQVREALDEEWQRLTQQAALVSLGETGDRHGKAALRREAALLALAWADSAPALLSPLPGGPLQDRLTAIKSFENLAQLLRHWRRTTADWGFSEQEQEQIVTAVRQLSTQITLVLGGIATAPAPQQVAALAAVEALGREAEIARPVLLRLCRESRSPFVRWAALRTLAQLQPAATTDEWNRVATALNDDDSDVRCMALRLLATWAEADDETMTLTSHASPHGNSRPQRLAAIQGAARRLERGGPQEQELALRLLHALASEAFPAMPQLRTAAREARPEQRRLAVAILAKMGRPAEATLRLALTDPDEEVRAIATRALQQLDR